MSGITARKDDFWRKMITLAAPIALQNLVATLLNLVDTLMVGQLGDAAIAAVGLANQLFFLLMLFLFGISSGSAIFMAQYWGKRDLRSIHRVQGLCLALSALLSLVFGLVGLTAPRWVLSLFSNDPEVVALGAEYLRIAAIGYLPTAVTQVYASALRSTEQVRAPMAVSIVALGVNTTLNYLLILGHMGFPRMGVSGAALATIIARGVECALLLLIVYGKQMTAAAPIRDMLNQRREFYPRFFKTTTPVILNEGLWALGVTLYNAVYAHISTEAIASIQIVGTLERLAMVVVFGAGHACAVMVGNRIGAGEQDRAFADARRFVWMALVFGVLGGLIIVGLRRPVMELYQVSEAVYRGCMNIFLVMAASMPFRCFDFTIVVGILRSGGDTRYSLFLDIGAVWLLGLPGAYVTGLLLGWPVHWVYAAVTVLEEGFRASLGLRRFFSGKWIHNLVEEPVAGECEA
jgi:putative MATE family efflux protein